MKKLFIGFSVLISVSAFAQTYSDFERGFEQGKAVCEQELWSCSVKYKVTYDGIVTEETETLEAFSRSKAIQNLMTSCDRWIPEVRNPCIKVIREGGAVCKKL